jgi:predicted TIM-barrel fold metal-dependent hydrolase
MNRREFLLSAASAALLSHPARAAEKPNGVPAIDTHVHFYDPTRPEGVPWPRPSEALLYAPHLPDKFRAASASLNVLGTIVVEASPWVEDNQWLLDLAETTPEVVGIVGNLRLGQPEFITQLRRFTGNPLFRGIRVGLGALKDSRLPAVAADFTRLADADLSLDVLGRGPIIDATLRLVRDWPTLRIIVNHLPFPEWDGDVRALRTALVELSRHKNVYVKVSDVARRANNRVIEDPTYYRPALDVLFKLFGPDRVVHASNWPVSERAAPYATVHRIVADYFETKGRAAAESYFWRNSFAAYRWIPRGPSAILHP